MKNAFKEKQKVKVAMAMGMTFCGAINLN